MKCQVKLTHTVTLIVEGESEEKIQDWLNSTTPDEAYWLAYDNDGSPNTDYDEEIICIVQDDSNVDYVIREEE